MRRSARPNPIRRWISLSGKAYNVAFAQTGWELHAKSFAMHDFPGPFAGWAGLPSKTPGSFTSFTAACYRNANLFGFLFQQIFDGQGQFDFDIRAAFRFQTYISCPAVRTPAESA